MKKILCFFMMALFVSMSWGQSKASKQLPINVHKNERLDSGQVAYLEKKYTNPNGFEISEEVFANNCIVMSRLFLYLNMEFAGDKEYDEESLEWRRTNFAIPSKWYGVPLYCPVTSEEKRCHVYVLRYKKVYRFGEPVKDGDPDTVDCQYENGLLKSVKGTSENGNIYIFRYDNNHRIVSLTLYTADGIEIDYLGYTGIACSIKYNDANSLNYSLKGGFNTHYYIIPFGYSNSNDIDYHNISFYTKNRPWFFSGTYYKTNYTGEIHIVEEMQYFKSQQVKILGYQKWTDLTKRGEKEGWKVGKWYHKWECVYYFTEKGALVPNGNRKEKWIFEYEKHE